MIYLLPLIFVIGVLIGRWSVRYEENRGTTDAPAPCIHGYMDWSDCPDCGH